MRQCLEIAKVPDLEHQKKLAEACAREGLTGAAAKKRAQALKNGEIAETPASKEKAPSAPFTFAWKGNGLMVKGRLFTPHTESIGQYVNELTDAVDRFMEAEKAHTVAQAA